MIRLVEENDSIEGVRFDISARKLNPCSPLSYNIEGVIYYFHKFKSKIRGKAVIIEEYSPKKFLIAEKSHLDIKDEIEADVIELFLLKTSAKEILSNYSHVHGIQNFISNEHSYGIIKAPFKFVLERVNRPKNLKA